MNELAMRIHSAEMLEPNATSHIVAACILFDRRSQPKIHRPRKEDPKKKASRASMASGTPKMSPPKREYSDQFMPHWNSCTIPVTTPVTKLITGRLPQNVAMFCHTSLPVRT